MAESTRSAPRSSGGVIAILILIVAPIIYFVPFVAVFLDEVVFETRMVRYLPSGCRTAFEIIYWPILNTFFR